MAANQNVNAGMTLNTFTPANVTITAGDTVTWNNTNGIHNVHLENGFFDQPTNPTSAPWTVSNTFTTTGTYRYYCELHGGPGGTGMSGTSPSSPPTRRRRAPRP